MQFTKRLHAGIRSGDITVSVRIWQRPHVKVGNRYAFAGGEIEVDAIRMITMDDITPQLARKSGFNGVVDLLKIAKHGRGENVYLVEFHYVDGNMLDSSAAAVESASVAAKPIARTSPRAKAKRPARRPRTMS
jgi:hypothetical protein